MVFKDKTGTEQALSELSDHDKQFLQADMNGENPNNDPKKYMAFYLMPSATVGFEPIHHIDPQVMDNMVNLLHKGMYGPCFCEGNDCNCLTCECHKGSYPQVFDDAVTEYIEEQYQKYLVLKKQKKLKLAALKAKGETVEDLSESESDSSDEECTCEGECDCDDKELTDTSEEEDDDDDDIPQLNINLNN